MTKYYERIQRQHPQLVSEWESLTDKKFPEDLTWRKYVNDVDVLQMEIEEKREKNDPNLERILGDEKIIERISVTGAFECDIDISHLDLTRQDFDKGLDDGQKAELQRLLDKLKLKGVDLGMLFPVELECRVPAEYEIENIL